MSSQSAVADSTAAEHKKFRKIAIASFVGTLIESYDFVLYSLAAALVFPTVFFPGLGGAMAVAASMATLGVAFVARPAGAIIFGHFGDKLGRKKMLIFTITLMGVGTVLIGLVPGTDVIGMAAPIIVILLRMIQGVAAGGEWAGAVLFVTEHAPPGKRGFYAMFPQLGHALPNALSGATFLFVSLAVPQDAFLAWGWRVPFLLAGVLLAFSLYMRLQVEESPVFTKSVATQQAQAEQPKAEQPKKKAPLFAAFREQPLTLLKGAGVALASLTLLYVANAFITNYGNTQLGLSQNSVLLVSTIAGLFFATFTVVSSVISDRWGRRRVIGWTQVVGAVWCLMLFPILNLATFPTYLIALMVTMTIAGLAYGAVGAYLPEQFSPAHRYSAAGVAYQVSGVIGGGVMPLIAPIMVENWGSESFGIALAVVVAISALCTLTLRENKDEEIV